jgi:peptide-methionine (R)-S-oxide reductase
MYKCVNCSADLFESDFKFDSGSGWPSFWSSIAGAVKEEVDLSHGMRRIEIMCAAVCVHFM